MLVPELVISPTPFQSKACPRKSKLKHNYYRAVIYISHIPHGFYEKAMRAFFGQFGTVTNLRLGRWGISHLLYD